MPRWKTRRVESKCGVMWRLHLVYVIVYTEYSMWATTTGTISVYGPARRCRPIDGLYIHFEGHERVVEGLWSIYEVYLVSPVDPALG